jgi:hypothetical protein
VLPAQREERDPLIMEIGHIINIRETILFYPFLFKFNHVFLFISDTASKALNQPGFAASL